MLVPTLMAVGIGQIPAPPAWSKSWRKVASIPYSEYTVNALPEVITEDGVGLISGSGKLYRFKFSGSEETINLCEIRALNSRANIQVTTEAQGIKWLGAQGRDSAFIEDYKIRVDKVIAASTMDSFLLMYSGRKAAGARDKQFLCQLSGNPAAGDRTTEVTSKGPFISLKQIGGKNRYAYLTASGSGPKMLLRSGLIDNGTIRGTTPGNDPFAAFNTVAVDFRFPRDSYVQTVFDQSDGLVLGLERGGSSYKTLIRGVAIGIKPPQRISFSKPKGCYDVLVFSAGNRVFANGLEKKKRNGYTLLIPSHLFQWSKVGWADLGPYTIWGSSLSGKWILLQSTIDRKIMWLVAP